VQDCFDVHVGSNSNARGAYVLGGTCPGGGGGGVGLRPATKYSTNTCLSVSKLTDHQSKPTQAKTTAY
jgi:hypothetical protein